MKRGFTLLEVLISIAIFSFLIVLLYKILDQTRFSNDLFNKNIEVLNNKNSLYKIFLEDIIKSSKVTLIEDKNKNTILKLVSNNIFHKAENNNITYLLDYTKNLIRIESKEEFKLYETTDTFYENVFVDRILKDIELFKVLEKSSNFYFVIKQKEKAAVYLNISKIIITQKK